jgi:hypothetical protein
MTRPADPSDLREALTEDQVQRRDLMFAAAVRNSRLPLSTGLSGQVNSCNDFR